jgi:hypothetical protein
MLRGTWTIGGGRLEILHSELSRRALDDVRRAALEVSGLLELDRQPDFSGVD